VNPLKAGLFRQGGNAADSGAKSREWTETYPKDFRNQGLNRGVLVRWPEAELRMSGRLKAQRRLPFRFPFLRHLPFRKLALSPAGDWESPSICGLFARNLDGTGTEWPGFFSPNRGILSKA
jgi:hypothetical protein